MTKKNTKRALFASVISLLLCVTMLVGSTFAWFTDNATTNVNTIQSGKLDIQLLDGNTDKANSLEGQTLTFKKAEAGKNEAVLFEPGAKYSLTQVYLHNAGNLHAKYKVTITGIDGSAKLAEVLDVYVAGTKVGTLASLVTNGGVINSSTIAPGAYYSFGTIELEMQTTAGNAYQDLTMKGIAITVQATQATVERDSEDNQYDAGAQYAEYWKTSADPNDVPAENNGVISISTAQELANFAASVNGGNSYSGKTVKLTADIDLLNKIWEPIGQTGATQFLGVFDGNGHTISNLYVDASAETGETYSSGLFGWIERHGDAQLAVKNLTIDGAYVTGHHNVAVIAGYLIGTVENCQVKNAAILCTHANGEACGDKAGIITGIAADGCVVIKNCSATNCTVAAGRDAGQLIGANTVNATVENCTATNVVVSATGDCTGANIKNEIVGRS